MARTGKKWYIVVIVASLLCPVIADGNDVKMFKIEKLIMEHEGFRPKPYRCGSGKLTIGIGRNIENRGITMDEAMVLLRNDISECRADLRQIFPETYMGLSNNRQCALIDMRFNLGPTGFRGFRKLIKAIKSRNFAQAAKEIKNSVWYTQVGHRGQTVHDMMLNGE